MSDGTAVPVFAKKGAERSRKPKVVPSSGSDTDEENNEIRRISYRCKSPETPVPKDNELAYMGAQALVVQQEVITQDMITEGPHELNLLAMADEPGPSRSITVSMMEPEDVVDSLQSHTSKRKLYTHKTQAQPEILMTAEDTDYEDGDDQAFTDRRRVAKNERHNQRFQLVGKESLLQDHERNAPFIETFNRSLVKKEEKKDEIHKYTRILFTQNNSWLKFVTSQNEGEFFLEDLTAWESPRLSLPGLPKHWLDTVEQEASSGTKL